VPWGRPLVSPIRMPGLPVGCPRLNAMIGVIIAIVGVVLAVCGLLLTIRLPKERPNKNWVPTAAEAVGMAPNRHPIVRFEPPGRSGTSDLPCALRGHLAEGKRLLVLLDPLNPVMPYQMDAWKRHQLIVRILSLAGAALFVIGAVVFVLMTYVFK